MDTTTSSFVPQSSINFCSSASFANRAEAGSLLAEALNQIKVLHRSPLLLALPRGGVPVACQVARQLRISVDIFLTRKVSLPEQPEISIGTVSSGRVHILTQAAQQRIDQEDTAFQVAVESALSWEHAELERRECAYRRSRPAEPISSRSVIVIDDGLNTGATMRNAIRALRFLAPAQIVAAIPVASPEICAELQSEADLVVCPYTPNSFFSVRRCYRDFSPVLDLDIRNLLDSVSSHARQSPAKAFHA